MLLCSYCLSTFRNRPDRRRKKTAQGSVSCEGFSCFRSRRQQAGRGSCLFFLPTAPHASLTKHQSLVSSKAFSLPLHQNKGPTPCSNTHTITVAVAACSHLLHFQFAQTDSRRQGKRSQPTRSWVLRGLCKKCCRVCGFAVELLTALFLV